MKLCLNCGREIIGRKGNSKHCSDDCRKKYKGKKFYHDNKHREEFTAKRKAYHKEWSCTPKARYLQHSENAKARGIEMRLSFEEWWELWSPHWEERGNYRKVMCRKNDEGHYEKGNVFIDTHGSNTAFANAHRGI